MLKHHFIYDNGAAIKGKGYTFTVNRVTEHLRRYYRKYKTDGYVLLFDFSKYFDRISHELLKQTLCQIYTDKKILGLLFYFIDQFGPEGLGLGSQISQILALSSANKLDHYIKQILKIKEYGRYMDDGYLIHPSKQYLKQCLDQIKKMCAQLCIKLNEQKLQIVKLTRGFTFIKVRFHLSNSGRVIRCINRRSVRTVRHKLNAFEADLMSNYDMIVSWKSWYGYAKKFNAYTVISQLRQKYSINLLYN